MTTLLDMTYDELGNEVEKLGEKRYRTRQIAEWLNSCTPISDMSNLSKDFRARLAAAFSEGYPEIAGSLTSEDGTRKYLLRLADGNVVESVVMQYEYGNTICISTQIGCAMGCRFCASCKNGLERNLTSGEILGEVVRVNQTLGSGRNITNVVMMGIGEPFANFDNVVKAIRLLNSETGLNISMRNISLSTCGIVPKIEEFTELDIPVTLCLSLHSVFDRKRREIMPIAEKYSVSEIVAAMRKHSEKTGRRVIFEYILIKGFNDLAEDADEIKRLTAGMNCHFNLIPYNRIDEMPFEAPTKKEVYRFLEMLNERGVSATVRRSLGSDIAGACGQLRAGYMKNA